MFRRLLDTAAAALVMLAVSPLLAAAAVHTACAAAYRVWWERRHLRDATRGIVQLIAAERQAISAAESLVHGLYETWYAPDVDTTPAPHVTA